MLELQDHAAFKDHLRDFLVQTKSFSSQDNADLFADEAAAAREVSHAVYCILYFKVIKVKSSMHCLFDILPHGIGWLCLVMCLLVLLVDSHHQAHGHSVLHRHWCTQAERQRLASIPGMLNPNDIKQEDMLDA